MSVDLLSELTSAEAGFLYAAGHCESGSERGWMVDEVAAPPLREFFGDGSNGAGRLDDEALERLMQGRFDSWWRGRRRHVEQLKRNLIDEFLGQMTKETDESSTSLATNLLSTFVTRRAIGEVIEEIGGDLSPVSHRFFDLRSFLDGHDSRGLAGRLVVVGALLVSSLNRGALRRRLAANLRRLPPAIVGEIRDTLEGGYELDRSLKRRVFEIYGRVAAESGSAEEEFALVGLSFVVGACAFRQNGGLQLLRRQLPDSLSPWVDHFSAACMGSGKPELMPLMADALQALHSHDEEEREDE
jgi:hypothetical protein